MTPHAFGKKVAYDYLTKYAAKGFHTVNDNWWSEWLNTPKGTNTASYVDKWYNPWTQNTDPISRGEAPLMWLGRGAMGTAAAAGAAAGGLAAAPALGVGGGAATAGTGTGAAATTTAAAARASSPLWRKILGHGALYMGADKLNDMIFPAETGAQQGDAQQPQTPTGTSPLNYAALGGLAGAGIGGLAGAFMPGERIETDPATGWPRKKKRTALRGGLRGSLMGGLAGTALGGMFGALQSQKQSAAYSFGQRAATCL